MTNFNARTLIVEPNSSYLSNIHTSPIMVPNTSTMGLMMLLSTFQYQPSLMGPMYAGAAATAGKAAFITSGGQAYQDRLAAMVTKNVIDVIHSAGITDTEMAITLGTAKIIRDRRIDVNGPKLGSIKTSLTATLGSGSLGIKYEW